MKKEDQQIPEDTDIEQMLWELCHPLEVKSELRQDIQNSKNHPANIPEKPITLFKIHKHLLSEQNIGLTLQTKKFDGAKIWEWILNDPKKAKETIAKSIQNYLEEAGYREVIFTDIPNPKVKYTTKIRINEIDQHHLGQTLIFEGIIKNKTNKLFRDQKIIWFCPNCGDTVEEEITIEQTLNNEPPHHNKNCYPCFQKTGKPAKLKIKETKKTTFLIITLQDPPDDPNQENQTIQAIFDGTLSNEGFERQLTRGKKIRILAQITHITTKERKTTYQKILNIYGLNEENIQEEQKELNQQELQELQKQTNLTQYWSKQIYTAIHGFQKIKESIIVQLVGTNQQQIGNKRNKTTLNILLIGDAGAGKSTFLKLTEQYGLKTRYANASSSSSVGITASVIKDDLTGSYMIDAGAIPLTNNGVICLDEIDKISEEDLKNLHEAMQENTITVNKAGCHETLQANTSILGAGNPKKGIFDQYEELQNQVTIPITILNRFELIYLIKDKTNLEEDEKIVERIIKNQLLQEKEPIELFKKYLRTAKKIEATIPDELNEKIKKLYLSLRKNGDPKKIILNTRSVENIIRLTLAHTKAELRQTSTEEDFEWAKKTYMDGIGLIATDTITGEIDIQKLETGTSKNEKKVEEIIIETIETSEHKKATYEEIRHAIDERISDLQLEKLIEKMKKEGFLFEPRTNEYRTIK